MSELENIDHNRRQLLGVATRGLVAAGAATLLPSQAAATPANDAIRTFSFKASATELDDRRHRVAATRWPEAQTVADESQGVRLEAVQQLAQHWANSYDWRECEAKLNALPQFVTKIDGLDIHFIHVLSKHENALPMIVTHGWPGSFIEQMKLIEPPVSAGLTAGDRRGG